MMIRIYFLPVETIDGVDRVAGADSIHEALLLCTDQPDTRKLIMDTSQDEHDALLIVAIEVRDATQEELDQYAARVIIPPPDPDAIRAAELLANSPVVITQPEMWELMRIFGRSLNLTD